MDRKLLGNIGEAKAKLYFVEQGYEVYIPETVNPTIDILVMKDGVISSVQVKSTSRPVVKLETCYMRKNGNISKNFDATIFDILFVYHMPSDTFKILNAKEFHNKTQITYNNV